ncbi:MAG TPA: riboflavin synthase [Candidatus Krumholzibacteria bacterium]|nr:riboflavin synthase [Candidatus Krumholzibacteria bacterium]
MFTGLIETVGRVDAVSDADGVRALRVDAGDAIAAGLRPGDSVAVNGVCLTAERLDGRVFEATAVGETLARTTLGALEVGDPVNLETPVTTGRVFGGHIVQGHVDGVARVSAWDAGPNGGTLKVALPAQVYELCVEKGSIAIDGVSLTIASLAGDNEITVAIVPHTMTATTIGSYRPGSRVNVEADVIAKYVHEFVRRSQAAPAS